MMKKVNQTNEYGFYSKKLQKPFDTLEELLKAEEVAELIYFLCSEKSNFITGQIITCDGGFSL